MPNFEEVEIIAVTEENDQIIKVRIDQMYECSECGKTGPWSEFIAHVCD